MLCVWAALARRTLWTVMQSQVGLLDTYICAGADHMHAFGESAVNEWLVHPDVWLPSTSGQMESVPEMSANHVDATFVIQASRHAAPLVKGHGCRRL